MVVKISPPTARGDRAAGGGFAADRLPRAAHQPACTSALAAAKATALAMEAIPRISRAQSMDALSSQTNVAGYKRGAAGRRAHGALLPDVDDGGGHDPAGEGARAGCRRGRPAGARHRQTAGGAHDRLRRAPRGGRAGALARRPVARPRAGGQRRGRLRARADRGGARPPAAGVDRCDQGLRRGHHHGARARPPRAEAGHRGGRRRDEAGVGGRGPRRARRAATAS